MVNPTNRQGVSRVPRSSFLSNFVAAFEPSLPQYLAHATRDVAFLDDRG
jgi:hypothetical protein